MIRGVQVLDIEPFYGPPGKGGVDAVQPGDFCDQPVSWRPPHGPDRPDDLRKHFLCLADNDQVEEPLERRRVEHEGAAADDKRTGCAVFGPDRYARQ